MTAEWIGFMRDLTAVSALATVAIYLYKLRWPTLEIDRIAYLAITVASCAVASGAIIGVAAQHALVPWALFCLLPTVLFWLIELEFGTRILGLVFGLVLLAGAIFWKSTVLIPVTGLPTWPAIATANAIAAAGSALFALLTWLLAAMIGYGTTLTARRTARFYAITAAAVAEIAYRLVAWSILFQLAAFIAGLAALVQRQLAIGPVLALSAALVLSIGYAASRPGGAGWRPWLQLAATGAVVAALWQLRVF